MGHQTISLLLRLHLHSPYSATDCKISQTEDLIWVHYSFLTSSYPCLLFLETRIQTEWRNKRKGKTSSMCMGPIPILNHIWTACEVGHGKHSVPNRKGYVQKKVVLSLGPTLLILSNQWGGITPDLHISVIALCTPLNTIMTGKGEKLFGFCVWVFFLIKQWAQE